MLKLIVLLLAALPMVAIGVDGPDLERERRIASQIVDAIMDGDAVMLDAGGHEFLGIYTEAGDARGAVIVLHGRGFHPDWVDVVQPLRVGLAERGWNTLSLQMPVLHKEAKYYDYLEIMADAFPRIEAGIDFLREQGFDRIILIAHSCSVHMSMAWIDAGRLRDIDAFVGIGMGAVDYQQPMPKPFPLDEIDIPVLDVYGDQEYPAVIRGAPERRAAMKRAGNAKSGQIVVPDANHYFTNRGQALLDVVVAWLDEL